MFLKSTDAPTNLRIGVESKEEGRRYRKITSVHTSLFRQDSQKPLKQGNDIVTFAFCEDSPDYGMEDGLVGDGLGEE